MKLNKGMFVEMENVKGLMVCAYLNTYTGKSFEIFTDKRFERFAVAEASHPESVHEMVAFGIYWDDVVNYYINDPFSYT